MKYLAWLVPAVICHGTACGYKEFVTERYGTDAGDQPPSATGGSGGSRGRGGSGGTASPSTGGSGGAAGSPGTGGSGTGGTSPAGGAGGGSEADASSDVNPGGAVEVGPDQATPSARAFNLGGVASWKGNAAGAYSIVHEIVCDPAITGGFRHAEPELTKRQLRGGFGVLVGLCESGNHWDKVKAMVANGHDVFSNTFSHKCLTANNMLAMSCTGAMRSTNYMAEIDQAANMLRERTGVAPGFMLLPYDVCDPAAITRAKGLGYLGARCGGTGGNARGINATAFTDPFRVVYDLWGPGYSTYRTASQCMGVAAGAARPTGAPAGCRTYVLNRYVDDIITAKGWGLRGFHGFDDDTNSFQPIAPADYRAHLDAVATKVAMGQLWVEGPTVVVKYRVARQQCAAPTMMGSTLKFPMPSAECTKHATDLTYLVSTMDGTDLPALKVTQGGKQTMARKLGPNSYAIDADPTKGDAVLSE